MDRLVLARALGWFSIALGVAEVVAAGKLGSALGLANRATVLRLFGVREIAAGAGILANRRKEPWLWGRVAGDLLDLALLGTAWRAGNPRRRAAAVAGINVAAITALDVLCARQYRSRWGGWIH